MRISLIFFGLTLCCLVTAEVISRQEKHVSNAISKPLPSLKDLAPKEGEYHAVKIERVPASAPILDPHTSKVYFAGGCRDSYGRSYGPKDSGYDSCMNDDKPHDANGPFRKRKALGVGIIIGD